jgi:hypothetical protein
MREELEKLIAEHGIYPVLLSISDIARDRALGISIKNPPGPTQPAVPGLLGGGRANRSFSVNPPAAIA